MHSQKSAQSQIPSIAHALISLKTCISDLLTPVARVLNSLIFLKNGLLCQIITGGEDGWRRRGQSTSVKNVVLLL